MLHIAAIPSKAMESEHGFTILEILLVGSLATLLCTGFLSLFLHEIRALESLNRRSESIHQLRTGLETMVKELQDAEYYSCILLALSSTGEYTEVQFSPADSLDKYWYYVNDSHNLIRAVKRPGHDWGRNTIAEGVRYLHISSVVDSSNLNNLVLEVGDIAGKTQFTTVVSPGF